jgi:hypothetical protein
LNGSKRDRAIAPISPPSASVTTMGRELRPGVVLEGETLLCTEDPRKTAQIDALEAEVALDASPFVRHQQAGVGPDRLHAIAHETQVLAVAAGPRSSRRRRGPAPPDASA